MILVIRRVWLNSGRDNHNGLVYSDYTGQLLVSADWAVFSALSSSYINDLPDYIQNNWTVKRVADDTIIYHPITNQQDSNALQEDMDALQRWESDWLMHFHPQKCQTMHITNT